MDAHPFVRVYNGEDHDIRTKYASSQALVIPAHSYMIVPWDTACFLCGDPYLQDTNPRNTPRSFQLHRLKVYYGISEINDEDTAGRFPNLTITAPDGEDIPMIMHDPMGMKAPWRDTSAPTPEVDALRRQIDELAKSQADLLSLLAVREQVSPAGVSGMGTPAGDSKIEHAEEDDITFDTPRRTRISGRG